jgi:hypothetical protein
MYTPALLGLSDVVTGGALAVAWLFLLGLVFYRYRTGSASRRRTYLLSMGALFWIAFGLLQVGGSLSGTRGTAVEAVAIGSVLAGGLAGFRWWQVREATTDDGAGA